MEVIEPENPVEKVDLRGGSVELSINVESQLLGGDIITPINGNKSMTSTQDLLSVIRQLGVRSEIQLEVFRHGETFSRKYRRPKRPLLPMDFNGIAIFNQLYIVD
jgi:hypothetical protein